MSDFERLSLLALFMGVIASLVVFVILALQLRALRDQVRQSRQAVEHDHRRRRAQATIDFYAITLEKRSELRFLLPYDRDTDAVRDLLQKARNEDESAGKQITEYLSLFELLATGVNTGVFDLDIIDQVAGGRIRAIAANYRPWIDLRRARFDNQRLYCELTELAQTLENRRLSDRLRQNVLTNGEESAGQRS